MSHKLVVTFTGNSESSWSTTEDFMTDWLTIIPEEYRTSVNHQSNIAYVVRDVVDTNTCAVTISFVDHDARDAYLADNSHSFSVLTSAHGWTIEKAEVDDDA